MNNNWRKPKLQLCFSVISWFFDWLRIFWIGSVLTYHFYKLNCIYMNFRKKELSLCHKLWFSNPNIFETQCRKPLIFQTYIFWSNKSHSLKNQRFTTLESTDIGIRKSEFVAKTQFLWHSFISIIRDKNIRHNHIMGRDQKVI